MTTFSINLEDVDIAHLPLRTGLYNDFLRRELYEFEVKKREDESNEDPSPIMYTCQICDIKVPAAFAKEHSISFKHRANARIASVAASRLRDLATAPPLSPVEQPTAPFCANCSAIVGKDHEKTKEHSVAVIHDQLLWHLMIAYVKDDDESKDDLKNIINNDVNETKPHDDSKVDGDKNDAVVNNTNAVKACGEGDNTKIFTDDKDQKDYLDESTANEADDDNSLTADPDPEVKDSSNKYKIDAVDDDQISNNYTKTESAEIINESYGREFDYSFNAKNEGSNPGVAYNLNQNKNHENTKTENADSYQVFNSDVKTENFEIIDDNTTANDYYESLTFTENAFKCELEMKNILNENKTNENTKPDNADSYEVENSHAENDAATVDNMKNDNLNVNEIPTKHVIGINLRRKNEDVLVKFNVSYGKNGRFNVTDELNNDVKFRVESVDDFKKAQGHKQNVADLLFDCTSHQTVQVEDTEVVLPTCRSSKTGAISKINIEEKQTVEPPNDRDSKPDKIVTRCCRAHHTHTCTHHSKHAEAKVEPHIAKNIYETHGTRPYLEVLCNILQIDYANWCYKEINGDVYIHRCMRATMDNFHSFKYFKNGFLLCIGCNERLSLDDSDVHKYERSHMHMVAQYPDLNGVRRLQHGNHCVLCNIRLENKAIAVHLKTRNHYTNFNKRKPDPIKLKKLKASPVKKENNNTDVNNANVDGSNINKADKIVVDKPNDYAKYILPDTSDEDTDGIGDKKSKTFKRNKKNTVNEHKAIKPTKYTKIAADKDNKSINNEYEPTSELEGSSEIHYPFAISIPGSVRCVVCDILVTHRTHSMKEHVRGMRHLKNDPKKSLKRG